ncbi:MAG: VOC family protein [Phycisphaeraceae bacterium]
MQVQPYLFFNGNCEEAVAFYRETLGAEVESLMHYRDSPDPEMCPPGVTDVADKVMHASFRIGETMVMASDDPTGQTKGHTGFALSLTAADEAEADRLFVALSDGGQVQMPLDKTFFSPRFGMVADRFGVSWMIVVVPENASAG